MRAMKIAATAALLAVIAGCSSVPGAKKTVVVVPGGQQPQAQTQVTALNDMCADFTQAHAPVKDAYAKFDALAQGKDWSWSDAGSSGDDLAPLLRQESAAVKGFLGAGASGMVADKLKKIQGVADKLADDIEQRASPGDTGPDKDLYASTARLVETLCKTGYAK